MRKLKRHSQSEWAALWTRIESFGIAALARKLHLAPDVIRNWRSRGSIPEYQWENLHRHAGIPMEEIVPKIARKP